MFRITYLLTMPTAVAALDPLLWLVPAGGAHEGKESPLPAGALNRLERPKDVRDSNYYVRDMAFSPDGKTLAARCNDNTVRFWGMPSGKERAKLLLDPDGPRNSFGRNLLAYSPDGKTLVTSALYEKGIQLWDTATSKQRLKCIEPSVPSSLALSPDGQVVASCGSYGVRLRSVKDGREMGLFDFQAGLKRRYGGEAAIAFSPDGRTLVSAGRSGATSEGFIRLRDWRTAKELHQFTLKEPVMVCLAYSPDGKALASCPGTQFPQVVMWDMMAGTRVHELKGHEKECHRVAFSPNGWLVASCGGVEKAIRVWNPFTGEEVAKFVPPDSRGVICVAFSPDGKLLASGQGNGTVLLWDATKLAPSKPLQARTDELGRWWAQLGRKDKVAWEAVWSLVRSGDKATALLGDHLKPAPALDAKQVARLIADLDADAPRTRDAASRDLAKLGTAVEADLRKALADKPSLEVKKRLEALLKPLMAGFVTDPAELQQLRGIQVLEQVGTPEAKKLLQALAKGAPGARRTRDAQLALERLHRRRH